MGFVVLEPNGGQVPWHNQEQEEIYYVVEGTGEMCLGEERQIVTSGQAAFIPPTVFHQLTNIVAHWRQELEGTLPKAGVDAPPLPIGAQPQCTDKPAG